MAPVVWFIAYYHVKPEKTDLKNSSLGKNFSVDIKGIRRFYNSGLLVNKDNTHTIIASQ